MTKVKLIVTHYQNLCDKYHSRFFYQDSEGRDDLECLLDKLQELISHDADQAVQTRIVYLDTDEALGDRRLREHLRPEDFKNAVDAAYMCYHPDLMVILGADDIVPFIPLRDPAKPWLGSIPSDLPYACDGGCGNRVISTCQADVFQNPTRTISRIPDVARNSELGIKILMRTLGGAILTGQQSAAAFQQP